MEAVVSGNHESFHFNVDGYTRTENVIPYNYPAVSNGETWNPQVGTHNITGTLYSENGATGDACDQVALQIHIVSCSSDCSISVAYDNIICDGQGTTTINDDMFTVDVVVTGTGTGNEWTGTLGSQTKSGTYGVATTFGPFPTNSGSNISGWFMDKTDSNCAFDIIVQAPNGCSSTNTTCTGDINSIILTNDDNESVTLVDLSLIHI